MSETEPRTPSSFGTLRRNCQDAVDLFAEARQSRTLDPRLQYSIDDTFVRFLSWAGNVGALAPGNASIDFRLQDESKVKTLLQSMLSRLKEDLQDLVKPPLDIMDEEEEPESADEGVYSEEEGDEEDHDGMEYGDDSDGTSSGRLESMDEGKDGEAERDGYKADIGDDDEDSCEESESDEDKSLESQALRERANPHLRVASHSEVHERVHSPTCSSSGSASSSSDYGSSTSSDSEKDEIWSATMKNMRKTIDQLVRFAVILRRPASSNENSRVRAFMATKSNDELDLIAFGEEEYGLRENLAWRLRAVDFPNLPEALHERLFESFVFRKMLLKYRERHQAKLKQGTKLLPSYSSPLDNAPSTQPVSIPSIPQIPEPAGISELDYGFLQLDHNMGDTPTPNTGEHATIQPPPPPRTEHSMGWTLYSDTIASHANHENHSTYERSLLGSAITGAGARRREHYNIPKHFNASDADFGGSADVCEYCRKIISREEKEGARWSRHVLRDLKPYICLFPECTDADPYYGNTEEWLSHMQEHACFWKCQAQITELAVAQGCEGDFNSEAELQEHYHMHHQQHLSEGQILQLLDICVVPSSDTFGVLASRLNRTVTVCPMCNKTPDVDCEPVSEAVDDDEIALRKGTVLYDCLLSHLEEFALRILADDELNATEGESWPGRTRTERSGSAITTRASQYGHDEQMSDGSDNTETGLPVAPSLWQANEHAELLQYSQDLAEVDDMDDTVRNEYEEMLKLRFSTTVNALSLDANQDTLLQEFWKKQQLKEGKSDR
ncbi:hypothetical protein BJ508DRAFT_170753 [Ascobolus immersus RN42]|uniref:C2H2-type domain-containing protein n=1 Tax=Ascobolus immersus RN42 TaxID=1160509 RepID=A0A3N4HUW7_ASCIM|nr:hypothetical protein BJ508DRAFT_170753 [Ascobolus immersus RN42]